VFLTGPQSSYFRLELFAGKARRENHFDWGLYYRFKDQREAFWRERIDTEPAIQQLASAHFTAFQRSVKTTLGLLPHAPSVLDVGLSSEQLDRAILMHTGGRVTVLDVEADAAQSYRDAFGDRGAFVQGDVISYAAEPANCGQYDLVYSTGLIEHFPDKTDIVGAHVALAKPGGLVLVYVPIDTPVQRSLVGLAAEFENFGHRELMTPEELRQACLHPELEILAAEEVGFFAALWGRRRVAG
jgi:SAM-dependent methyltransferase